ncbi:hypothetical protein DEO23_06760 [Brachybacterium endophyticum]|uniref:NAD(P)-binding domain-containing protein n=2 Tax=Brachybacterium endophyticum TaxID=2182385 RepID=A0A2U2RMD2_9MICO|nr:hypothetical protein DEO23_06760 [Brachybacterium endophyticum]
MIVVTTPTGQIGSQVVQELLERGEGVRVIVRDPARLASEVRSRVEVVEGSHDDPAVLDTALGGADALFWLIPPGSTAPSAEAHYLGFARAGAAAVARNGVTRVVGVTSAGHGWPHPAGVLSAAFAMDEVLRSSGADYRALSLPFYMENLLGQVSVIKDQGVFAMTCAGDRLLASIATRDIASAAAELLTDPSWSGQEDLPLFGPDRLTPDQMAAIIGEELGRPVAYQRMPMDDFAAMLRSRGASEQAITDTTQMFAAQDGGIYEEDWKTARLARTDFRTWCREVLAPAYRAL